jgi:hypothetical protein
MVDGSGRNRPRTVWQTTVAIALILVATGLRYVSRRNSAVTLSLRLTGSTYTFRVSSTTAPTPESDVQGATLEETTHLAGVRPDD